MKLFYEDLVQPAIVKQVSKQSPIAWERNACGNPQRTEAAINAGSGIERLNFSIAGLTAVNDK